MFSGQTLYDPWIYQSFNIFFTSLPIIWFGIYDKEISCNILENDVEYYKQGIQGKLFNTKRFWKWVSYAAGQGIILCYLTLYQNDTYNTFGKTQNMWSIGKI